RQLLGRQRGRVDRVVGQLATKNRCHLLGDVEGDGALRLEGGRGDVRRGDEVAQAEERILSDRLAQEDVRGRSRQAPLGQRLRQRGLVDDAAAGGVDEARGRFDQGQHAGVYQVTGPLHEWGVDRDEVGPCEEVVEGDQLYVELLRSLAGDGRVGGDDVH